MSFAWGALHQNTGQTRTSAGVSSRRPLDVESNGYGIARALVVHMRNLTDANTGRIAQKLVTRLSTIGASDVRAFRVRNPLCAESDEAIRLLVLAAHPSDVGFLPREGT